MFEFIKKVFVAAMTFFSCNILNVNSLRCVPMSNQECKTRPEIININIDKPLFYHYSILVNKCGDSCNNINALFANCVSLILLKA